MGSRDLLAISTFILGFHMEFSVITTGIRNELQIKYILSQ